MPLRFYFILPLIFISCFAHDHYHTQTKINPQTHVTYSNIIKLRHLKTNFWLHSHQIRITRGGAFSVTAYKEDDHGSFWQILEQQTNKKQKTYKDFVRCGDSIVLYSTISDYYLRTDQTQFGMTTELIPLVHGIKKNQIDHGIVWTIQCAEKDNQQILNYGDKIRLKHDTTGKYVSTDGSSFYTEGNCGRGCQIVGQLQLHAIQNGHYSDDTLFQIEGGMVIDRYEDQKIQQ